MKILYLYDFPLWGNGSGTYLRNLIDKVKKKHSVALVAPERRKIPKIRQFFVKPPFQLPVFIGHPELQGSKRYKELNSAELTKLQRAFTFATIRAIEKFKPDIMHYHHLGMLSSVASYARAITGVDYIATTHGSDLKHLKEDARFWRLTANTIRDTKRITAVSGHTRRWFLKMFNHNINPGLARKTNIIPGGINIEEHKTKQKTKSIDSRYKIAEKKVALFVGRITEEKGVEYIIKAAERINGEIIIVGDGPALPQLKKIKQKSILHNVHLVGYIGKEKSDLLKKLYTRADLIIAPSVIDEALGLVILEAMYYSKPVIATKKGGIPLAVKENETGFFVKPRNATDIAEKVNIIFSDEEKSKKMGEAAKRIVEEKFTWEKIAERFINIYKQSSANGSNGVSMPKKIK